MKIRLPLLLTASIVAFSAFYITTSQALDASPAVTVTSIDGQQFELARTTGKIRLVTFYSTDCPICQRDIPDLNHAHQHFNKDQFDIIAVAMPYDHAYDVARMHESGSMDYSLAHDSDGQISAAFPNVRFTPTTFLIDNYGKIVWRHVGRLRHTVLNQRIKALIEPEQLANKSIEQ